MPVEENPPSADNRANSLCRAKFRFPILHSCNSCTPVLPVTSLLRLVPGGQILLHHLGRLFRRFGSVQDLSARIPEVVFIVRVAFRERIW